jgi:hypothetical protein
MSNNTSQQQKKENSQRMKKLKVQLDTSLFVVPTSQGAYYATATHTVEAQRSFLLQLIINNHRRRISQDLIKEWASDNQQDKNPLSSGLKIFFRLQQLGYIEGEKKQPNQIPQGPLDDILPSIIGSLSANKKAILADNNGLYLASSGYPHEVAEELAAMSVDLYSLYSRHQKLLVNNLNIETGALAMIAPDGYSQLGFWPIHIGSTVFVLILGGVPQLQHKMFTVLVKLLATKYL